MKKETNIKEELKLDKLLPVLLFKIFQYLEPRDLSFISAVNKSLRKIAQDNSVSLWKPFFEQLITAEEFSKIAHGTHQVSFWKQPFLKQQRFASEWITTYLDRNLKNVNQAYYFQGLSYIEKQYLPLDAAKLVLKFMAETKHDINFQGPTGQTISHFLMSEWNREIAELLMLAGADFQIKDLYGITPLDVLRDSLFQNSLASLTGGGTKTVEEVTLFIQEYKDRFDLNTIPEIFKPDNAMQFKEIMTEVNKEIKREIDPKQAEEMETHGTEVICRIS